jgi:sarcosine oxidase
VTIERRFAVLGLGGVGSGVAYRLARRAGADVVGVEQFELGHARGASEDHSRIIRRSYHTPGYVRLAGAAYEAWGELEEEAGETLVVRTGGLDLFPGGAAIAVEDYTASMRTEGVPFEELEGPDVVDRWPQWRLDRGVRALFQEDGGFVAASRANEAHRRLAREHGALLRERSPVLRIHESGGEIDLEAGDDRVTCERLVVCADAWTNDVLSMLGVTALPLTLTKEQVVYLESPSVEDFHPDRFPMWIWMDDPSFYGFPAFGEPAPKVAQDVGGPELTRPERRGDAPDPDALERVRRFVDDHLPGAAGPVRALRTCVYTMPPDRDFVVDTVPDHPNVLVILGAAHGFKFCSLFGSIAADLLLDGATEHDLSAFRFDRELLQMEDPPTSFLI